MIDAILYSDPGCPWAYSSNPALRVLEWRFRDQLSWRLVMIGLREEASDAAVRAFDPERALARWRIFEQRYGMPFASEPKARPSGTGRGCRAVVAASLLAPGREWSVLRQLQLAYFTGSLYLDDAESIGAALEGVSDVDATALAERIDDDAVVAEYERQRAEARAAAGTAAEAQEKTTVSDGAVRYTAPSVVFRRGSDHAHAGGWQPLLAYDTVLANFAPELERVPPPDSPLELLSYFRDGLTTAEVAQLLARGADPAPDLEATELALSELAAAGAAVRSRVGTGSIWRLADAVAV